MLADPQRFNLYSYVRNNPLRFVDPDGEAIRLSDNEVERNKQLLALQADIPGQAAGYLYVNPVEIKDANGNVTSTEYYVGIYTNGPDGKGPAFETINPVAKEFASIINDTTIVTIHSVPPGTVVDRRSVAPKGGDAAGHTFGTGSNTRVTLAFPPGPIGTKNEYKQWDPVEGYKMSDLQAGYRDSGLVLAHELGHAQGRMAGKTSTSGSELRLENKVRKLRDANAATRKVH
jgi:hypothetical protein